MKVLVESVSYAPNISGVAVMCKNLVTYLVEHGHEVVVIAPSQTLRSSLETDPNLPIKIYRIRAIKNPTRKGFHIPFYAKWQVQRIVRQEKPDIVHVHDPLATAKYVRNTALSLTIPVIATNHFMLDNIVVYFPHWFRPVLRWRLTRWLVNFYNRCTIVTCPSETVAQTLRQQGVTTPIIAISNGINLDRFYSYTDPHVLKSELHLPERPTILYVGSLVKEKSIDVLLRALPLIREKVDAHCVICGTGSYELSLKELCGQLNLTRYVTFTGAIAHESEELVELYQLSDIFVLPSANETQGIVAMEAMAAGKPVVGTQTGAIRELVEEGQNGYLFEADNPESLAESVLKILPNRALREKMSEASIKIIAKHDLNQTLETYLSLYQSCQNK